jgi:carboxyl-terminal processing protease
VTDVDDDDFDGGFDWKLYAAFVVPLAVGAAVFVHFLQHAWTRAPSDVGWSDDARREVQSIVESRYVEPVGDERSEALFDAAMKGYVEELDPFTRYYSAKDRATLERDTSGTFGGIGVRIDSAPTGMLVVGVRKGGPADKAGVGLGDVIEKVGGTPLTGRDRDAMIETIKGPEGTSVELSVRPAGGGEPRTLTTVRAKIEVDAVPSVRVLPGSPSVGYVRVGQFTDTTAADAREAFRTVVGQGARTLVLDLRHDLGGVVQAAVDVASLFLAPETLVCVSRSREGAREYRTAVKDGFEPLDLPLIVLVDRSTASASEILAGALQDHGRAVLVGERTYGKFVMQTIIPLAHRDAVLQLTTARYETPRGRSDQRDEVHGVPGGLMPDVYSSLRSKDEEYAVAVEFARQAGLAWKVLPGREATGAADRQLQAAIDLLRGGPAPADMVAPRTN